MDDARATAAMIASAPFRSMVAQLEGTAALITLEQLVLAVHDGHNERVRKAAGTAAPAGRKRKVSTCTYCGGTEVPAHLSRRTCPKRVRDEAEAARAPPAPAATRTDK